MFEFQAQDLFVADKGGALFLVELEDESASTIQVGNLRKRIKDTKPQYGEQWNFLGSLKSAKDDELVANHIDFEKKERIVVVRSWSSWYGTFLEEQILRRYPHISFPFFCLIRLILMLAFVAIIIGFTQASFKLPGKEVPYTLQTLGVFIASFFLGIWSVPTVGIYLALGAAGGHVFAGGESGITPLLHSYSSGFLWGFLTTSFVVGILVSWRGWDRNVYSWFIATCLGWFALFIPGLAFFAAKVGGNWSIAVNQALVPFLPSEAIKFVIVICLIPMTWFATSRALNALNPRIAIHRSLKSEMIAFFNPRLISF